MKRIALSILTAALFHHRVLLPSLFAAPDFDQLRQENRDKSSKVDFDQLPPKKNRDKGCC